MITVTTDAGIYAGASAEEVVRAMRDSQWNAPERKRDWMDEVRDRVRSVYGVDIAPDLTATEFLKALDTAGVAVVAFA